MKELSAKPVKNHGNLLVKFVKSEVVNPMITMVARSVMLSMNSSMIKHAISMDAKSTIKQVVLSVLHHTN